MATTGPHESGAAAPRRVHEGVFEGPRAWRRDTLAEADWRMPVPAACLGEIEAVAAMLRAERMPVLLLDPREYPLAACAALMSDARRRLDEGCGVVVLDRLPVERWSLEESRQAFWLLGALLGRPVSQSIQGEVIVDVADTGVPKRIGVRGFRTSVGQPPHTDNSFNRCPPDHVSLLCLRKAAEGGESRFVSFYTVHNELRARHPELLARLYRPFHQDRQGDFGPGESQTVSYPVFDCDGGDLRVRYTHFTIPAGYETAGEPFEGETRAAFEAISALVEDPSLHCSFVIEPGELQIVNNRGFGHGRTAFTDGPDPSARRHLLRLWHREHGRRTYSG